jgi:hypothetical protein
LAEALKGNSQEVGRKRCGGTMREDFRMPYSTRDDFEEAA